MPAKHLAQVVQAVCHCTRVAHIYVEGGATAAELLRRFQWTRLELLSEVAPGVATLASPTAPSIRLTVKPGSYNWPDHVCIFLH